MSSAITSTPLSRALRSTGTIAFESLATMRIVFAPAAIMFSTAVTWLAWSVTVLPAAVRSFAPRALASAVAPLLIATKNGLVSVFVMSPITGTSAALEAAAVASTMMNSATRSSSMKASFGRDPMSVSAVVHS